MTTGLALVFAASMLALRAPAAQAGPNPNPNLVPTGATLVYDYQDDYGKGTMTVDVTAKDAGTDDIDVTLTLSDGSSYSGSGTMRELPTLFALDFWINTSDSSLRYIGQIKRSTGVGSGKLQVSGTHVWYPWSTLGFHTEK